MEVAASGLPCPMHRHPLAFLPRQQPNKTYQNAKIRIFHIIDLLCVRIIYYQRMI
jgi:hypothetical protein